MRCHRYRKVLEVTKQDLTCQFDFMVHTLGGLGVYFFKVILETSNIRDFFKISEEGLDGIFAQWTGWNKHQNVSKEVHHLVATDIVEMALLVCKSTGTVPNYHVAALQSREGRLPN